MINSIVERNRFTSPITQTEKKILSSAIRLFLENGYSKTTLKMISEDCGLRQGTIAYHFIIRLLVGYLIDFKMKNQADYTKKWYQVSDTEMKLYQKLKVKTWKNKMPTFDMDVFDVSKHSWDEIIQATCQSELVHETNVVFSFLPVVAAIWFGSFEVFLITSMLGAIFDLMFVFMQRFNRARIVKMRRRR